MTTSAERTKAPGQARPTSTCPPTTAGPDMKSALATEPRVRTVRPDLDEDGATRGQRALVGIFVVVPTLALVAAIPVAWAWGFLGWHDVVIALVFYWISGLGITVGFHRYFTHGSFKA